jgi:hypothetical protein
MPSTIAGCYDWRVHFTFLDGKLAYDCVRCTTRCCNGLGFALPHEALIPFLRRAPALAPFLQLQARGAHFVDLADGCWLLDSDGRCGVETAHGHAAKPAICRLFPLQLRRVYDQVVVDLQLLSCPLEDARGKSPAPGVTLVGWDDAAREVSECGAAFIREVSPPSGAPDDFLRREAEIRDRAADALEARDPVALLAQAHASDGEGLAALLVCWREFLQISDEEWTGLAAAVTRPFGLALPMLRFGEMMLGGPPYPKRMRGLPSRLLAGAFLTGLSVRAGRPASLRAIAELWRFGPTLREALARWHEVRPLLDTPAPPGSPPELAEALARVQARADRPLGEALAACDLDPALRPVLLRLVADRLA